MLHITLTFQMRCGTLTRGPLRLESLGRHLNVALRGRERFRVVHLARIRSPLVDFDSSIMMHRDFPTAVKMTCIDAPTPGSKTSVVTIWRISLL